MNKYNTIYGQLLSVIDRPGFDRLCREKESDKYCKDFTTWNQFVVMTFAQITKQNGLRSIENALNNQCNSFYHLGLNKEVKRSTISYANGKRDPAFFEALYYQLLNKLNHGQRKIIKRKLYAVDATTIGLCLTDFPWAKFRSTKAGVKVHVKLDVSESKPDLLFITNAEEHENNTLGKMGLKPGEVVTFDKGYNNYKQFAEFCHNGVYFVTRLKDNADYKILKRRKTFSDKITSDHIIQFTGVVAGKKCPYKLRRIRAVDKDTGSSIVILTNIRSESALAIAKMYRKRWQIELFFKAIKQNLKIKRFFGTSENAVKTQIWVAMIVYLLYIMLKNEKSNFSKCFTHFISELAVCLFQHIDLGEWMSGTHPPRVIPIPNTCPSQLMLAL